jgi:Zn-dependent protease
MRDPLTWSFPLGRLFGINIRVHLFFPLVAIGLVLRVAFQKDVLPLLWLEACVLMALLFVSVLLHEFGHCFGARWVDGEANEVLIWPLGGLANIEVPHTPWANFVATIAGPAVNLLLCLVTAGLLAGAGMMPSLNPVIYPFDTVLYSWKDDTYAGNKKGRGDLSKFTAYQETGQKDQWVSKTQVDPATSKTLNGKAVDVVKVEPWKVDLRKADAEKKVEEAWLLKADDKVEVQETAVPNSIWMVQIARLFQLNYLLLLLNLLPAFPLDGGRMLQCFLWWRNDYRHGTLTAIFIGFLVMFATILLAIVTGEPLVLLLAVFIYLSCRRQWILLEGGGEESVFGYDFSEGYTSLEREQPAQGASRRPSWIKKRVAAAPRRPETAARTGTARGGGAAHGRAAGEGAARRHAGADRRGTPLPEAGQREIPQPVGGLG